MELNLATDGLTVYKALASQSRLDILKHLANEPATCSELAQHLGLSKVIVSRHLKELESADLIHLSHNYRSDDGRKKVYTLKVDHININFPQRIYLPYKKKTHEIDLGLFSDFKVEPTCGLASATHVIGDFDDPRSFVANERAAASLLWFSKGYIEYRIPNLLEVDEHPELLEFSMEIASEFPNSNNIWPSDITFTINGIEAGTWTVPGNYSDVRGKLTPAWWDSSYSQYGLLIHLRSNHKDTGIDGHFLSNVRIEEFELNNSPWITLRIGIKEDAVNAGGITLFGKDFGNVAQNIILSIYYSENRDKY